MEGSFVTSVAATRGLRPYEKLAVAVIRSGLASSGWRKWLRSASGWWWCGLLGLDAGYVEAGIAERTRSRSTNKKAKGTGEVM